MEGTEAFPGDGPTLASLARVVTTVFLSLIVMNLYFLWSVDAWWGLFDGPKGIVSPAIDAWVIQPLAILIAFSQFWSYWVVDGLERTHRLSSFESVLLTSLLSTFFWGPVVFLWRWRPRGRQRAA